MASRLLLPWRRLAAGLRAAAAAGRPPVPPAAPARRLCSSSTPRTTPSMAMVFTCRVCGTRATKLFSRRAYRHGVVVVRCDGCANLHLVADNLGWFKDQGEAKNVEEILRQRGEEVRNLTTEEGPLLELDGGAGPPRGPPPDAGEK